MADDDHREKDKPAQETIVALKSRVERDDSPGQSDGDPPPQIPATETAVSQRVHADEREAGAAVLDFQEAARSAVHGKKARRLKAMQKAFENFLPGNKESRQQRRRKKRKNKDKGKK